MLKMKMNQSPSNVVILGSTGSIGRSTIDVVKHSGGRLNVLGLTAHTNLTEAVCQARQHEPKWLVATDAVRASHFDWSELPKTTELLIGADHLESIASDHEVDVVVAAIVGSAGLRSTLAAVDAGKRIALANKEALVMAGSLFMRQSVRNHAEIIPVDSEHSAIFQALNTGNRGQLKRIILTASGGPFRQFTAQQMATVTVQQALDHPTWEMGPKITVDSATMMNKALEIVEACWLFDVQPDQVEVLIHPQSIVHSLVEFVDGSVLAQMSPPDMKLPIQFALSHPDRWTCPATQMDWTQTISLEFHPPDRDRFPALDLGFEVARFGGTAGAVMNAANEAAVQKFLDGQLAFSEIVPACRAVLNSHTFDAEPTFEQLIQLDRWAREEVLKWICA